MPEYNNYELYNIPEIKGNLDIAEGNRIRLNREYEIDSIDDAQLYLRHVIEFRKFLLRTEKLHGEQYSKQVANMLFVGENGIYSDKLKFLNELIQNVDDCEYEDQEHPELLIKFEDKDKKIILTYNENGFTTKDVFSLTGVWESSKNLTDKDKIKIGEKGIGFKSVFGVAEKVLIQSGYFSFYLFSDQPTLPVMEYDGFSYQKGTKLTVHINNKNLDQVQIYRMINEKYKNANKMLSDNPVMFLNKLSRITYYKDDDNYIEFSISAKKSENQQWLAEDDVELYFNNRSNGQNNAKLIQCFRYSAMIKYTKRMCKSRYEDADFSERIHYLIAVIPKPSQGIKNGALYSFLPTKIQTCVPFSIHAPFKLNMQREGIDSQGNNEWFMHTLNRMQAFVRKIYIDLAQRVNDRILDYIPVKGRQTLFDGEGNDDQYRLLRYNAWSLNTVEYTELNKLYKPAIKDYDIIPSYIGGFTTVTNVYCFENKTFEEAKILSKYFGRNDALFAGDYRPDIERYGIKVVRNVYSQLVNTALRKQEYTKEIFQYLKGIADKTWIKGIEMNYPSGCSMTLEQINEVMHFKTLWPIFYDQMIEEFKKGKSIRVLFIPDMIPDESQNEFKAFLQDNQGLIEERFNNFIQTHRLVKIDGWTTYQYIVTEDCFLYGDLYACISNFYKEIQLKNFDNFRLLLELEAVNHKWENMLENNPTISETEFLDELENNHLLQKAKLGKYYSKIIDLISQSGADEYRFLNEILQNADDCIYPKGETPSFEMTVKDNKLIVTYNELGFTKENVRALCEIEESTKKFLISSQHDQTGEKGIGFKSVFSFCSKVDIHSGKFHFYIEEKTPTIPRRIKELSPDSIQPGTKMEFSLKKSISNTIWISENILKLIICMKKLRSFCFNGKKINITRETDKLIIELDDRQYCFSIYSYIFTPSSNALFYRRKAKPGISGNQKIYFYIPIDYLYGFQYYLYNTLPTNIKISIPMIIDAPLELTVSREYFQDNIWNREVIGRIHEGYFNILNKMKVNNYASLFKILPSSKELFQNLPFSSRYDLVNEIKRQRIFKTIGSAEWKSLINIQNPYIPYQIEIFLWKNYGNKYGDHSSRNALDLVIDEKNKRQLALLGLKQSLYDEALVRVLESVFNVINNENLKSDKKLKELFYSFLLRPENTGRQDNLLNRKEIVPVINARGQTEYRINENIYYSPKGKNYKSGSDYYILDEKVISKLDYNRLFRVVAEEFRESLGEELYVKRIREWLKIRDLQRRFNLFWKEYKDNKEYFKKIIIHHFTEDEKSKIPVKTLSGNFCLSNQALLSKVNLRFLKDNLVLSYTEIGDYAETLNVKHLEDIQRFADFPFAYWNKEALEELLKVNFAHPEVLYPDLINSYRIDDNMLEIYFWDLYKICKFDNKTLDYWGRRFDGLVIARKNKENLKDISRISKEVRNIGFKFENIKYWDFDHMDVVEEIYTNAYQQILDQSIAKNLETWLKKSKILYTNLPLPNGSALLWRNDKLENIVLVDRNKRLDSEIIEEFSIMLKDLFLININLERHMHLYTRDGMKFITRKPYTKKDVENISRRTWQFTWNGADVEEEKDFLCRPIQSYGIIYGGYAKRCPLCQARIHTELTGFRIVKLSQSGTVNNTEITDDFHILCCQNCWDAFRYSEETFIDLEKWHNTGELRITVVLNGERYDFTEFKPKLAHQALLYAINKKSISKLEFEMNEK